MGGLRQHECIRRRSACAVDRVAQDCMSTPSLHTPSRIPIRSRYTNIHVTSEHHTLLVIRALVLSVCRYSPTPNTVHCTRSVRYAWVPPSPRAPTALRCHLACTVWFTCLHTPPPSPSNSPTAIQGVLPRCVGSLVSYNSLTLLPHARERDGRHLTRLRVSQRGAQSR